MNEMKKNILLPGAALLMLAACSQEELLPNKEANENAKPTLTVIATQGGDADTRIAYNPSNDGKTISPTWTEGDAIFVCRAENPTDLIELTLTEGAGTNKGTFTTTEEILWEEGSELVAYYKANDKMYFNYSYSDEEFNYSEFEFKSLAYYFQQVQTENGSMDHLKDVNYMKSETFSFEEDAVSSLQFSQMGAIMQLNLSGLSGKTVKELRLMLDDGSESLVSSKHYFYSDDNVGGKSIFCDEFFMSSASLFLGEEDAGIVAGETLTAYLMLGATELTKDKKLTLLAFTTDGVYSASLTGDVLEAGKKYTLNKTMGTYSLWEGEGTAQSPYQISTEDDLMTIHTFLKMGASTNGLHFKLMNDIEMDPSKADYRYFLSIGGEDIMDAGAEKRPFEGVFDGAGHTISGLKFFNPNYTDVGLFYAISANGVVKDLHLADVNLYGIDNVGGIAVYNYGTIEGCSVSGSIMVYTCYAGGIVAQNDGTIIGCSNHASVSTSYYTQGIVGGIAARCTKASFIIACYNTGSFTSDCVNLETVGDILGVNESGASVTITACYSMGVTCNGTTPPTNVAAFIGVNSGTANLRGCCWSEGNAYTGSEATLSGGGGTTQVQPDWVTKKLVESMNSALSNGGYGWLYVENTDEVTKTKEPYKLQRIQTQ